MPTSVLIVDDDPVIQLLLRVNFEMDGFDVATADDGEQGLEMIRKRVPDLVLLDVMMPKLDGYEVLEAVRSDVRTRDITVVLLSAKPQDGGRQPAGQRGPDGYITKPFDPLRLITQVKDILAERQS